ncbi:hypothetical protein KEG57_21780 [Polyangium jinanense]|uniref:Uncharacterized protein n=1 Tax=Polyangium jinanense TaxID=2829994 RepID=A0A9X3X2S6_9BACT|nr:hypothetical protein [Polyangium jinanense]
MLGACAGDGGVSEAEDGDTSEGGTAQSDAQTRRCLSVTPDATLSLLAGETEKSSTSRGPSYNTGVAGTLHGCNSYVVEVSVPSTSTPPLDYESSFQFHAEKSTPIREDLCNVAEMQFRVYAWNIVVGDWAFVGGGVKEGKWIPGGPLTSPECRFFPKPGAYTEFGNHFEPPLAGTNRYRILSSVMLPDAFFAEVRVSVQRDHEIFLE